MDWVAFLTEHDISFVTRGPNTKRGEVSVQCPYCGDDDPSHHMGISLTTENWGCLRSAQHRGHGPHNLIAALLGCSTPQARLTAAAFSVADPESLDSTLAMLTRISDRPRPSQGPVTPLTLPPEAKPIKATGSTGRFWRYLEGRHFDDVADLVSRYQLRCATTGKQKDRVIIPLFQGGQLVGWTGRAIQPTVNAPRYLSSSEAVKRVVFNEDDLWQGGKVLYVVEGPFDALKLDYYGEPSRVRATCLFGVTMTMDQVCTLRQLRRQFRKVVILLDRGAIEPAFDALDWLQGPNVSIGALPEAFKDPGQMSRDEVEEFIRRDL